MTEVYNPVSVILALGSNLGDRSGYLQAAIRLLAVNPQMIHYQSSQRYETVPVDMVDGETAPLFLNMVARFETTLSPEALLGVCLDAERQLGRSRSKSTAGGAESRTIDIDILFYGDAVMDGPELAIPHPRLHERAFVLLPLLELAPNWLHPRLNQTISELCQSQALQKTHPIPIS